MSDAIPTLDNLADACGLTASDLRIGPLRASNSPTPSPKTPPPTARSPHLPSRVPPSAAMLGFDSPADDVECDKLLRISKVAVEKSSPSSLELLCLPAAMRAFSLQSLESMTRDCTELGEQVRSCARGIHECEMCSRSAVHQFSCSNQRL